MKTWYKLDNVGKFYSFTSKTRIPAAFRYSVTLTDEIDEYFLQKSLNQTLKDYPNFYVHLKRGFFWYYLEAANSKVVVEKEHLPICSKIYKDSDNVLFRVNYFQNRINFEVSHILSDGRGSLKFFQSLVSRYLILKYHLTGIDVLDKSSDYEKSEDSFDKYYRKEKVKEQEKNKIYQYKGSKRKTITYMEYHISTKEAIDLAHRYNTSLTVLLLANLICAYKKEMKETELDKTIKIDVPVDLRQFFNSGTSRNFFGVTSVSYNFKNKSDKLEDVIKSVDEELKSSINIDKLRNRMNKMVSFEKNIFARMAPIFLKDLVLNIIDKISNADCTCCLSNIGQVKMNEKLDKYIENFNVLSTTGSLKITVCSYKNDLSIGISSKYESNNIIKTFCSLFADNNIKGKLNINWGDENEEV